MTPEEAFEACEELSEFIALHPGLVRDFREATDKEEFARLHGGDLIEYIRLADLWSQGRKVLTAHWKKRAESAFEEVERRMMDS